MSLFSREVAESESEKLERGGSVQMILRRSAPILRPDHEPRVIRLYSEWDAAPLALTYRVLESPAPSFMGTTNDVECPHSDMTTRQVYWGGYVGSERRNLCVYNLCSHKPRPVHSSKVCALGGYDNKSAFTPFLPPHHTRATHNPAAVPNVPISIVLPSHMIQPCPTETFKSLGTPDYHKSGIQSVTVTFAQNTLPPSHPSHNQSGESGVGPRCRHVGSCWKRWRYG